MSHLLLSLGASLALSNLAPSDLNKDNEHWLSFKAAHNKSYESNRIEMLRLAVFVDNKRKVDRFNAEHSAEAGYELDLNHFADMSHLEADGFNGLKLSTERHWPQISLDEFINDILNDKSIEVPDEVDWRKVKGRVTRVKNQDWSFGGPRKGNLSLTGDEIVELSEQNLLDCVPEDNGCEGGLALDAFNYIKAVLMTRYHTRTKQKLESAVLTKRCQPIRMQAGPKSRLPRRDLGYLNHAMLVVGYGIDKQLGDFWIVKNSFGSNWGENGYIRMTHQCGIATFATIPTF